MNFNHSRYVTYHDCPRRFYWKFVQNLWPRKMALPLLVGKATHAGLAAHYERGRDVMASVSEEFTRVRDEAGVGWLAVELEELKQQEEYVLQIMKWYKEQYPTEPWEVLSPEVEGSFKLGPHTIFFRADGVVAWQGRPWLLENKTTAQLGPSFFKQFEMDGQITTYVHGIHEVMKIDPIGAIINAIRKSKKLDRAEFARMPIGRPPAQVKQFMDQFEVELSTIASMIEDKEEEASWYMHTASCYRWNRPCDYLELCKTNDAVMRERFIATQFTPREEDYVDRGETDDE